MMRNYKMNVLGIFSILELDPQNITLVFTEKLGSVG